MTHTCSRCNGPISQTLDYQRVLGWERIKGPATLKGKGFHIEGKREEFLCSECMRKLKRGVAPEQESFL